MKNYKITDKATKSIIGVVAMTPDQARRAEKDFIVKEAQPKRSDLGASTAGRSPGADNGRPKKENAARLPSTAATNQKKKGRLIIHQSKVKNNDERKNNIKRKNY